MTNNNRFSNTLEIAKQLRKEHASSPFYENIDDVNKNLHKPDIFILTHDQNNDKIKIKTKKV